jgi:hypothetical protein
VSEASEERSEPQPVEPEGASKAVASVLSEAALLTEHERQ